VVDFLESLVAVPGRWRAQLWLAQHKLRTGDARGGVELLRRCADDVARDPQALLTASAELGKAGRVAELVELVLPRYDERRQRPETGFNLLQALIQLGRLDEGRALHARLAALRLPPLAATLEQFAQRLGLAAPPAQAAPEPGSPAPAGAPSAPVEVRLFLVQGPLWVQGLGAPWLAPDKPGAPLVTFVAFADEALAEAVGRPRVDEEVGRLTSALPMYLAEAVHLRTAARADTVIPLLPGGAFVVTGRTWPVERLLAGRPADQRPAYVVQGSLARDEGGYRVELVVFDGAGGAELHRIRALGLRKLAPSALRLEDELVAWLTGRGIARTAPRAGVLGKLFGAGRKEAGVAVRPGAQAVEAHVHALACLLGQAIPAVGLGSRENLPDERALVDACLDLARREPRSGAAQAIAACSVLFAVRYGSPQLERPLAELVRAIEADTDPDGVLARLAPALWLRIGRREQAEAARRQRLEAAPDAAYRAWLEALAPR
jgi:hypothetical protein